MALRLRRDDDANKRSVVVDIARLGKAASANNWRPDRHFLPREFVLGREANTIASWWRLSGQLGIVLELVVLATCRTTTYSPQAFLALASAAEAYHTLTSGCTAGMAFAERLRRQVLRIGLPIRDVLQLGDAAKFAHHVKDVRNFVAHGMSKPQPPSALRNPETFVDLVKCLQAVTKANILLDIGFSASETTQLIENAHGPNGWFS